MFRGNRSQAALEFLMTYGWAILVVLIVISALAYFGVLNPQSMLPSRCTMPVGFSCSDYIVSGSGATDSIRLRIVNGQSSAITITSLAFTPGNGNTYTPATGCVNSTVQTVQANTDGVIGAPCTTAIPAGMINGQKYRWNIVMKYYTADSTVDFSKTITGELYSAVE